MLESITHSPHSACVLKVDESRTYTPLNYRKKAFRAEGSLVLNQELNYFLVRRKQENGTHFDKKKGARKRPFILTMLMLACCDRPS